MTATFIHQGDAIDHVPDHDLEAGAIVVLGALVGVTTRALPQQHLGALQLRGVFEIPRGDIGFVGVGDRIYWSEYEHTAKRHQADGVYFGLCVRDSRDGDPTIRVRLNCA